MKIFVAPEPPAYVPPLTEPQIRVIKNYFETDPDANWNFICELLDSKHDDAVIKLWEEAMTHRTW